MLKNITRLEHTIGDKVYHFTCDSDSPLPHVKEALFQFLKDVGNIEDQTRAAQEALKKSQEAPAAVSVPCADEPCCDSQLGCK